jgi:hypothetical protein
MASNPSTCASQEKNKASRAKIKNKVAGWGRALPAISTPFKNLSKKDFFFVISHSLYQYLKSYFANLRAFFARLNKFICVGGQSETLRN